MNQLPPIRLLQMHPNDNVAVLLRASKSGERLPFNGGDVLMKSDAGTGHKVAISKIAIGGKIYKNGYPIGSATQVIEPGEHVHLHNLKSDYLPTFTPDQNEFHQ